ncbi:MAG: hypothetical protein ABIE22_02195 [archaeon]
MVERFYNLDPRKIKIVNLIPIGRSSSIFLQGLLDWHPEIITILGNFYPEKSDLQSRRFEVIAKKIYGKINAMTKHYNTTYDLGRNFPEGKFAGYLKEYTDVFGMSIGSLFIGAHYAYARHYKRDISKIKYILAHAHGATLFHQIVKDFPKQKLIFTIRDPRANYLSYKKIGILVHGTLYQYENYLLYRKLKKIGYPIIIIRHEDMHTKYEEVKKGLIEFLGIKKSKSLDSCSFFNLAYDGSESKISSSQNLSDTRPNKKFVNEKWKSDLSTSELNLIQFIFRKMMEEFKYRKYYSGGEIVIKFLNTDVRSLSRSNLESKKGIKKFLLTFARFIYQIPILGIILIDISLLLYYFFMIILAILKVIVKKV